MRHSSETEKWLHLAPNDVKQLHKNTDYTISEKHIFVLSVQVLFVLHAIL